MAASVLDRRRGAWQHVAKVEPDRILVRIPGCAEGDKPRVAEEIRVLPHQLHCAVPSIPPESLREPGRSLLSCAVMAVG